MNDSARTGPPFSGEPTLRGDPAGGLAALLQEQRTRWERGERPPAEEFIARRPDLGADAEAALDLITNEILLREEGGETANLEEYLRRFPRFSSELQIQFDVERALEGSTLAQRPGLDVTGLGRRVSLTELPEIPGYEILGVLGRGGMGVVYQARHVKLKRVVALKMILAEAHAGPEQLDRFHREAEAVARLQHSHIVQIYEVGEHAGRPYISLEFVEGGSLAGQLKGTPLPAQQAASLLETLARAIHYAHERGILHRDLKPANVLLTLEGQPKITDFGLAKQLDVEAGQTETGMIVGTPSYMAPEQAWGKSKIRTVGPAVDVYALGAILYELVTGKPPFNAASPLDTVFQVVSEEPIAPSRLQRKIPRDLETICMKCLQKEPRKRYGSAQQLAEDLARFLKAEPILARPVGRPERLWRWCRRNPLLAALGSLAAVTVIGGWLFWSFTERRQAEIEQRRLLQAEKYRSDLRSSTEAQSKLALAELQAGRFGSARDILEHALERIANEPSLASPRADLQARLERTQRLVDFYDLANKVERTLTERERLDAEGAKVGSRLCKNALDQLGIFDHEKWMEHLPDKDLTPKQRDQLRTEVYRQLIYLAGVLVGGGVERFFDPALAPTYRSALVAVAKARQFRPRSYVAGVLEAFCYAGLKQFDKVKPLPVRGPQTAVGHYFTGMLHAWIAGSPADPISRLLVGNPVTRLFLGTLQKSYGLDIKTPLVTAESHLRMAATLDPQHYWTHFWVGMTLEIANNPEGAELAYGACVGLRPDYPLGYLNRARAISEQVVKTKDALPKEQLCERAHVVLNEAIRLDPQSAPAFCARGEVFYYQAKYPQALADIGRALELDPKFVRALNARGNIHFDRKEYALAIGDYTAALRIEPAFAVCLANRGNAHYQQGHYAAAVADLTAALRGGAPYPWVYNVRGNALWAQGEYDKAIADHTAALHISPREAIFLANRGGVYTDKGEIDKAFVDLNEAIRLDPNYGPSYCFRSEAYYQQGKYPEALADASRAIQLDRQNSRAHNARGNAWSALQKHDEAIADYTEALRLLPQQAVYLTNRAGVYKEKGELDKALADLTEALRLDPHYTQASLWRAEVYYQLKKYPQAFADAGTALGLDLGFLGSKK